MKDLTNGNETKTIINFATPMLIGNIFQQVYSTVDSIVVGQFVGPHALAAVGTSFPIIFFMVSLVIGLSMGTTILVSQFFGAKDFEKVKSAINTGYITLFWAGLAMTIIGLLSANAILKLLNVPLDILPDALTYLRIIFAGLLTSFGYNIVSAVLRGLGDSKTPLYLLIAASLLNIILDLVFVIVFGWGVAGVAWATVISQAASFIGALIYLKKKNSLMTFSFRTSAFDKYLFKQGLRIGLPSGIQQSMVSIAMMILAGIVNTYGTVVMAAYAAASRLDSFASMPAMNLSQALSAFTGQNMGAGKTERVKRGHLSALALGSLISIIIGLVVVFFGRNLMALFTKDTDVMYEGGKYLAIVGSSYLLFSTMFINNGVMRGAGDAFIPMINTLLALWLVRIPCAIIFSKYLGLGTAGIWLSIPAGWLVGTVFSSLYYIGGKWKRKAIVKTP